MFLVILMVFLGGVTRLTESGLSIVEWKLISGTLPPLSEAAWAQEFAEYQTSPQFEKVNSSFTLADFKGIFWLEYLHRLLGRIIGLAVVVPLVYFAARRALPPRLLRRMVAVALLVGMQGTVGWIMVASGLNEQPRVEPLKLALHLLLAFTVFTLLLWTHWQIAGTPRPAAHRPVALAARGLLLLVVAQIFLGALVAGLRAGYSYNSYPLMDGALIPSGLYTLAPWWLNHLESVLTVQFQHRMGALVLVLAIFGFVAMAWHHLPDRRPLLQLMKLLVLQFSLGVATLLSVVNLWLASAHQVVALLLVAVLVRIIYLTPLDSHQPPEKKHR